MKSPIPTTNELWLADSLQFRQSQFRRVLQNAAVGLLSLRSLWSHDVSLIKCVTQIDIGIGSTIGRLGIGRHQVHLTR